MADYDEGVYPRRQPATGFPTPPGPAQFPATSPEPKTSQELLGDVRKGIAALNQGMKPILRAAAVTAGGQTLDWSQLGTMKRLMFQNTGASTVWIGFDIVGPNVDAFVSDLSFEVPANGAITIPRCLFQKIGVRCAGVSTSRVHAIAFQEDAGDFAGTLG
jgi:hypothetical protein